jgi:high-affinity nickel permease
MTNKKNIALAICIVIAILEFIILQDIAEKLPESHEVIWQAVQNLGFGIVAVALFIIAIGLPVFVVYYVNSYIQTWRKGRKYRKAQKQILDDPVHWPGHHKSKEQNGG